MGTRSSNPARFRISAGFFCAALVFTAEAQAQIAKVPSDDGRILFVNAEPAPALKISSRRSFKPVAPSAALSAAPSPKLSSFGQDIYLPSETSILTGKNRPAMSLDRDGAEKLVREAAERHRVDPALIRAVIQTESNWNPSAISRKGAVGLMQLIPTTAQRFGVNDMYSPQQNVDAGVRYLKTLLERYNGNMELALAAYNAGEGAVDRAHGVPSFRETRNYVQRVQSAYYRPGSGRQDGALMSAHAIRKETDPSGRRIFTND
jgi:soluble lytic murein transglycosylase-like protein